MSTLAPPKLAVQDFPKTEVIEALTAELLLVVKSEAGIRGISLPPEPPKILKTPVPMDSLSVVDALCVLEPILGFELKDNLVRTGGYHSIEAALEHLIPKIERAWVRKKGKKA